MNTARFPSLPILLVDDEQDMLRLYKVALRAAGINNLILCQDSREVMSLFPVQDIGVIVLDLRMPHVSGEELLAEIARDYPEIPVIVITGANEVKTAVRCMRMGAFDYMVKPVEEGRLCSSIRRAVDFCELRRENRLLRECVLGEQLEHPDAFKDIVTNSQKMHSLFQYAEAVAKSPQPVLITGETGVGKELMAKAVHNVSGRPGPFIAVNVAGLEDNLFSDALFGHMKGAFTGAEDPRGGLVEQASGGTLFLDEIGDLSTVSQVKLLRLLQDGEYFPLGSNVPKRSDARVIVATHRDLEAEVDRGELRKDLYYRLTTHHIHIPPLRERREDLGPLLDHFLERAAGILDKKKPTPPPELVDLLAIHDFPGNVRELESMVMDAVSSHRSKMLSSEAFKSRIGGKVPTPSTSNHKPFLQPIASASEFPKLREATLFLVSEAMRLANNNQAMAAKLLGISRPALNRRLKHGGE